jgi:hypothetical protein
MFFWIFLFGPALSLVVSLILGVLTPNYSSKTDEISYLVYGKYGTLQTLNFYVCGVLSILLSLQLISITNNPVYQGQALVQAGAFIYGISLILLRIFPTQRKDQKTYIATIHKLIFVMCVLLQGLLQIMFAAKNSSSAVAPYFYLCGVVTILGLAAMYYWKSSRGISQRLLVATIILWITIGSVLVY